MVVGELCYGTVMKDDDAEVRWNGYWVLWISPHSDQIETHRAGPIKEWELVKF